MLVLTIDSVKSIMAAAAECDDLPEAVKREVQTFADVNVAWLGRIPPAATIAIPSEQMARAISAAIAGVQPIARSSRSDISFYDAQVDSYQASGPRAGVDGPSFGRRASRLICLNSDDHGDGYILLSLTNFGFVHNGVQRARPPVGSEQ